MKKIYDYRFENVICNAFHKTKNLQKHWNRLKFYRRKQDEYANSDAKIKSGRKCKCLRRSVKASQHYKEKFDKAKKEWETTKDQYEQQNQGVLILVFRSQSFAEMALYELNDDGFRN